MESKTPYTPQLTEDSLSYFTQAQAIGLTSRYCCAKCFHEKGLATVLQRSHVPTTERLDRFIVYCTECGGNVASRKVGRITIWFLEHEGQKRLARGWEIRQAQAEAERRKAKQNGTYKFNVDETIKSLGF